MKQDQVEIGGTYIAKVSDRLVPVRLEGKHQRGGWYAINMATGKTIRIKSAQRLRGPVPAEKTGKPRTPTAAVQAAIAKDAAANAHAVDSNRIPTDPAATSNSTKKEADQSKTRKPSGLDAAAQVLAEAKEPMRCGEIVQKMLERGLWTTGGATPVATISAAIQREIKTKGDQSRFKKADRGLFTLNGK
jgi:hypothetical protein